MLINLGKIRFLALIILIFTLSDCTKEVSLPSSKPKLVKNKTKMIYPYKLPVAEYLAKAEVEQGMEQQNMLLLAAGKMIAERKSQQAALILNKVSPLSNVQRSEKQILLAQIALIKDKPQAALNLLKTVEQLEGASLYFQIQYQQLLAKAYKGTNNNLDSIKSRIALDNLLDEAHQQANRRSLWLSLINLKPTELESLSKENNSRALQGWVELALISLKNTGDNNLEPALQQWQAHFNNHPANALLAKDFITTKMMAKPKKVALLLPLSGSLAGPGQAILDGFMASYKKHQDENSYQVALYDTAKGDASTLYQQALDEGADYVVGPLTKAQVNTVAALEHPVPTLFLNDTLVNANELSYSFGLSPLNEAVQVALRAKAKGFSKALVIAPQNDWGRDISLAFKNQWEKNGGLISDTLLYAPNDDLNKKMQDFLHINASQARQKQVQQSLGQHIQTLPSRRQDFEFIFLLAYPSKARQILPLLRYYYAGDLPVYATSSVYSGSANPLKDKDLEGLIFCDIPWVFSHQMGSKNWPEQFNSYNRLYALGQNSYALTTHLNPLILFSAKSFQSINSTLYLKSDRKIRQTLEWGQFKQGLAHSLGTFT